MQNEMPSQRKLINAISCGFFFLDFPILLKWWCAHLWWWHQHHQHYQLPQSPRIHSMCSKKRRIKKKTHPKSIWKIKYKNIEFIFDNLFIRFAVVHRTLIAFHFHSFHLIDAGPGYRKLSQPILQIELFRSICKRNHETAKKLDNRTHSHFTSQFKVTH